MSIVWFVIILILLAFAIFAGESTLRMRGDVKMIREVVMDLRSKLIPTTTDASPDSAAVDDEDDDVSDDDPAPATFLPPVATTAKADATIVPPAATAKGEKEHFSEWHP